MNPIIFDGRAFALKREQQLAEKISKNRLSPRMGSIVFMEDPASLKYTQLKMQAAVRVGIEFSVEEVSMTQPLQMLQDKIWSFASREDFHGVMIQKPMKKSWKQVHPSPDRRLDPWWQQLVAQLSPQKDVDCLTPENLDKVYKKKWRILPATVKAIVTILHSAYQDHQLWQDSRDQFHLHGLSVVVIGRSDIVGQPVAAVLEQYGASVNLYGSDLDVSVLQQADIVVSATGREHLVSADMVKDGVVVIDVGAPGADVDFASVKDKASFITPVPYGVGPVTVVSLLENVLQVLS